MSDLLGIGASGLRAYSRALETTGDNVANAQTPGYVRRNVRLEEVRPAGTTPLYRNLVGPAGVGIGGVVRAVDPWLVADARVAGGDAEQSSVRATWLQATERALEAGDVGTYATALFNAADRLAADPGNDTLRQNFLQTADDAATAFRRTAAGLGAAAEGVAADAQGSVAQLNTDLAALVRVNDGLRRARAGSTNQAALTDERDRLLDRIAGTVSITTTYQATGAVAVSVSGGGNPLVTGTGPASVAVAVAGDGRLTFSTSAGAFTPASGRLAGLGEAASHIATQCGALDTLADGFATALNTAHANGRDQAGNAGLALLTGTGAAALAATALTPAQVAAADAVSSNGNALAFASLRGAGGVEAGWSGLVATQSQSVASARARDSAATSRSNGANAARDAIIAVDLNREAAELLRFQQAYEGSARVIQVARETFQSILNAL